MTASTPELTLDATVKRALQAFSEAGVPRPAVLFLMATGAEPLVERLRGSAEHALDGLVSLPAPWNAAVLHAGRLGAVQAWLFDDLSLEPRDARAPGWWSGLPLWLAAAAGASVCVHVSAGTALGEDGSRLAPGSLALLRDHLNLSGSNPLAGLGPSALGPLFPDTSLLHHAGLRVAALERAERLGLAAHEAVGACIGGPALETPAERRMLARLGADVAVQGLAEPLLAAAHAGLRVLSVVAVLDAGPSRPSVGAAGALDVARLVEQALEVQPDLLRLVSALADDLARAVAALDEAEDVDA